MNFKRIGNADGAKWARGDRQCGRWRCYNTTRDPSPSMDSSRILDTDMIQNTVHLLTAFLLFAVGTGQAAEFDAGQLNSQGQLLIDDHFDRLAVGKQWSTNDARALRTSGIEKSRFQSQAKIHDGTLQIRRTEGSDHGASVKTSAEFTDAVIQLRFRLTGEDTFGVNTNDPECKTVHAGHICRVEIGPKHVMIQDQKTGNMDNQYRKLRDEGASKEELEKRIAGKSIRRATQIAADQWHDLRIVLRGDAIEVAVDGTMVGEFNSEGIAHSPKRNIAFAVPRAVDIDNLKLWSLPTKR